MVGDSGENAPSIRLGVVCWVCPAASLSHFFSPLHSISRGIFSRREHVPCPFRERKTERFNTSGCAPSRGGRPRPVLRVLIGGTRRTPAPVPGRRTGTRYESSYH
jgi:hypothetical protein